MPDATGDWFRNLLANLIGPKRVPIIMAVITAAGLIIWHWDKIKALPLVSPLLSWISQREVWQQRLPRADTNRFSIAIAHLEHDKDEQYEILIIEALKDFAGNEQSIEPLRFARTIPLQGTKPEASERAGHDKAREYLKQSSADVLIWGTIHRINGHSAPRLYWTTLREGKRGQQVYQPEKFKLPDLFWSDLVQVLGLAIATYSADFSAQRGHFIANKFPPFITDPRIKS